MAKLSLFSCTKSTLSQVPITDGQLVVCTDTGDFYRDTKNDRIALGASVVTTSELPLSPIQNKLYLMNGAELQLFNGSEWVHINRAPRFVITADTITAFPKIGSALCIYIDKETNRSYRQDDDDTKYYCISNGDNDWHDIEMIDGGTP